MGSDFLTNFSSTVLLIQHQFFEPGVPTLLHESMHHELSSYSHDLCQSKDGKFSFECDVQEFSPYGIEKTYRKKLKIKYPEYIQKRI